MRVPWKKSNIGKNLVWVGEGVFIHGMMRVLQTKLDRMDNDIRLGYRQRYSFPKRFWYVVLEFPDGVVRETVEELDCLSEELLTTFVESSAFQETIKILYWFSEDARNVATSIEISYVLSEKCGKRGVPGVIIYWEK